MSLIMRENLGRKFFLQCTFLVKLREGTEPFFRDLVKSETNVVPFRVLPFLSTSKYSAEYFVLKHFLKEFCYFTNFFWR